MGKKLKLCEKRIGECRKIKCLGAYPHKCQIHNERHGCGLYISQPFCKENLLDVK